MAPTGLRAEGRDAGHPRRPGWAGGSSLPDRPPHLDSMHAAWGLPVRILPVVTPGGGSAPLQAGPSSSCSGPPVGSGHWCLPHLQGPLMVLALQKGSPRILGHPIRAEGGEGDTSWDVRTDRGSRETLHSAGEAALAPAGAPGWGRRPAGTALCQTRLLPWMEGEPLAHPPRGTAAASCRASPLDRPPGQLGPLARGAGTPVLGPVRSKGTSRHLQTQPHPAAEAPASTTAPHL